MCVSASVRQRLQHVAEVAAVGGHGRVVGAKRRLADRQHPLILFSCPFQARPAVGMDAPQPTAGYPLGHPGRTTVQDGHRLSLKGFPSLPPT
jgi:hypothetical protein